MASRVAAELRAAVPRPPVQVAVRLANPVTRRDREAVAPRDSVAAVLRDSAAAVRQDREAEGRHAVVRSETERQMVLTFSLVLIALLGAAVVSDLRARRIANALNLLVLVLGLTQAAMFGGGAGGLWHAALGVLTALAIWFPMFALRLIGAGDAKLMAASSAWLGWQGAITASLVTGAAGGVLGAYWLLRRYGIGRAAHALGLALRDPAQLRMQPFEARERVPYAMAVAVGVLVAWWSVAGENIRRALT